MQQLTPTQLEEHLNQAGEKPLLLDVREPWEFDICRIPHSQNLPMGQIPLRLHELDPTRETVLICHHGVRSLQVALYLRANGFEQLINLSGGVDGWAKEVDPEMAQY